MLALRQRSLVNPFEPSSCAAALRRPEILDAGLAERVTQPCNQRRLGTDDHQLDACVAAETR